MIEIYGPLDMNGGEAMIKHGTKLRSILFRQDPDGGVLTCEVGRAGVDEIEVFMVEEMPWAIVQNRSFKGPLCYNLNLVIAVELL